MNDLHTTAVVSWLRPVLDRTFTGVNAVIPVTRA